jgi:hypothetical protein
LIDEDVGTAPSNQVALRQRYVLATLRFGLTTNDTDEFVGNTYVDDSITTDFSYAETWTNAALSECKWYGVECALKNADSVVTRLELIGSLVAGRISDDLGLLTDLTELTLSGRDVPGLFDSTKIIWSLSGNALTGTIPSSLKTLTGLAHLDLSDNALTGAIPLWLESLTDLSSLGLYYNALTGTIPSSLEML